MKKSLQKNTYNQLVKDITALYDCARRALVEAYWQIGKASYTYPAQVQSVVDGNTIWAIIDCGFDTCIREKLRLHKIDTPELDTPQGEKARRYVNRVLGASSQIVVGTHSCDKYARYLADVFYLPGESSYERICSDGLYLNQELLDRGLAQAVD